MVRYSKILLAALLLTGLISTGYADLLSQWVMLKSDKKSSLKETIMTEVDKREGYSTLQEEAATLRVLNDEKAREDAAYKNSIAAARAEFTKTKNRWDSITSQFQTTSSEIEELQKDVNTVKAGIENCDSQIARYEQETKTQQDALKKWLKTEKQGEALVAVIYTRGFKDSKHELDSLADKLSAPMMVADMGVYIKSYTKLVNNILAEDFIQAISQGTAKWNGEEPILIELGKGLKGTDYLRIKRYELYPFQEPTSGKVKTGAGSDRVKVALVGSMYSLGTFLGQNGMYNLETFLAENGHKATNLDLSRVESVLAEISQTNKLAAEGLTEQVSGIQERIAAVTTKIANTRSDKESLLATLKRKEAQLEKPKAKLASLSASYKEAETSFHSAQANMQAINSVRETIILKTVLTTPKGSQTPAEAASESIIDKLQEVKNDARSQHSSTTTTVSSGQLVDETTTQAVTQAKIVAVKLVSFINEGDSVKVKIAFRVRMALESPAAETATAEEKPPENKPVESARAAQKKLAGPGKGKKRLAAAILPEKEAAEPVKEKPVAAPVKEKPSIKVSPQPGNTLTDPATGMELLLVKGGCFQMGDTFETGAWDEKPAHEVCLDSFYMGKYEVTQKQWEAIMKRNPAKFSRCGADCPVESVRWSDVQEFIQQLNAVSKGAFRLPSEAEWEYAARSGGSTDVYSGGETAEAVAWYGTLNGRTTFPVGRKAPNAFGLYDMSGNVWEWVQDWYDGYYYQNSPKNNPKGPATGSGVVARGGSWYDAVYSARVSTRTYFKPGYYANHVGFRLAAPVSP
jgi:formylglycine-generating enzyme required for sulfatase activity